MIGTWYGTLREATLIHSHTYGPLWVTTRQSMRRNSNCAWANEYTKWWIWKFFEFHQKYKRREEKQRKKQKNKKKEPIKIDVIQTADIYIHVQWRNKNWKHQILSIFFDTLDFNLRLYNKIYSIQNVKV